MRVLRAARIPPTVVYFLCLILYGFSLILSTIRKEGTQGDPPMYIDANGDQSLGDSILAHVSLQRKKMKRKHLDTPLTSVRDFFNRLNVTETICKRLIDIGGSSCNGIMDNNKLLCLDDDVFLQSKNCNIYSFGIGDDISFDYQMSQYGCHIYMFDPSISPSMVRENIKRHERLHFYPYGISNEKKTHSFNWTYVDSEATEVINGTSDSFANIRKMINHQELPIHYLKMDIEGSEWFVLPDMLANNGFENVQQFAVEIHTQPIINRTESDAISILQQMWDILKQLKKLGFLQVNYSPNPVKGTFYSDPISKELIPTCGELFYVKRAQ